MTKARIVLNDSMSVEELINHLHDYNPEARVAFHYNYGDHVRTEVADVVSDVEMAQVRYSDYHRLLTVVDDEYNDEDNDEDDLVDVVVIGSSSVR